jgi:ketosteroid isomerase-like protein
MSQENVGPEEDAMTGRPVSPGVKVFVDQGFECWNGGEVDLMADYYADDAEVDTSPGFPDGRTFRGREEFLAYFHDVWDAWDRLRMDPLDVLDLGDGRFVVEVRVWGKGRSSGIEIDQPMGFVYDVRADGKVARVQMFPSRDAALEAAGLPE